MTLSCLRHLPLLLCLLLACTPASERSRDTGGQPVGVRRESRRALTSAPRSEEPSGLAREPALPPLEPALQAWRASPGEDSAQRLAQAFFPENDWSEHPPGVKPVPEAAALSVAMPATASEPLELTTRGLTFLVTEESAEAAPKRTEGLARGTAFYGRRTFWKAHGGTQEGARWRTRRVESYEVREDTSQPWRSRLRVELPPAITAVNDAGDSLEFLDAAGVPQLRLHLPIARDASGLSRHGGARLHGVNEPQASAPSRLALAGRTLHVDMDVDLKGLTAPVVVDPGWSSSGEMGVARSFHTATWLPDGRVLVVGGRNADASLSSAELYNPSTGTWSATGSLAHARDSHTATLLLNGQVLVTGGKDDASSLASAELYNPATGTWSATGPLKQARAAHTTTLLPGGKVLTVGGSQGTTLLASAELYDASAGTWAPTGSLASSRTNHTLTLLPDGKVLAAGGCDTDGLNNLLDSAEAYDVASGKWAPTGTLTRPRCGHTATLLKSGQVLVAGGADGRATELYDPTRGTWTEESEMPEARSAHTATLLLPSGQVLVAGGGPVNSSVSSPTMIYDPVTRIWSAGETLAFRIANTATLLPDGRLLLVGGYSPIGYSTSPLALTELSAAAPGTWSFVAALNSYHHPATLNLLPNGQALILGGMDWDDSSFAELYDPAGWWLYTSPMFPARKEHSATLLLNGKVLVTGGFGSLDEPMDSAQLYDPTTGEWTSAGSLTFARGGHTATLLPDGQVLVAGGHQKIAWFVGDDALPLATAELYNPKKNTWSLVQPLAQKRQGHTATLLPDGRVLVTGGKNTQLGVLNSAEVFEPLTGAWTTLASRMAHRRSGHVASLLPGGKVLVMGGLGAGGTSGPSCELYDPASETWSQTGSMASAHDSPTATLLPAGQVLVVGGATTELYEPASGTWSPAGPLRDSRSNHNATLLLDGRVLVAGGLQRLDNDYSFLVLASAETFRASSEDPGRAPRITGVRPASVEPGDSLTVQGQRFLDLLASGGGTGQSAPTHFPLLTLRAMEGGRVEHLVGRGFSDASVTTTVPKLPPGFYVLSVILGGQSSSTVLFLGNTTPPDTALTSAPGALTQETRASFSFSSGDVDLFVFECSLDEAPFAPCSKTNTPMATFGSDGLSEGLHTFQVRARDIAGNVDPTPAMHTWRVDTLPPNTTLTSTPELVSASTGASFSFSSEPDASFECSVDGMPFMPCANPSTHGGLGDGRHTFQVRARDAAGNVDPTPDVHSWQVDTRAPETTLQSVPPPESASSSASFALSADEPGATFECSLDEAPFAPCGSTPTQTSLSHGPHFFRARAVDAAGNVDPSPATHTWDVDTELPDTHIVPTFEPVTNRAIPVFFFYATEPDAAFECSLDGALFTACPRDFPALSDGPHGLLVQTRDAVGNVDPTPAAHSWRVDTVVPNTLIDSPPSPVSRLSVPTFGFLADEPEAAFECSLDGAPFAACPQNFPELSDGRHTLAVQARDAAGNVDPTPATHAWRVDTTVPHLLITQHFGPVTPAPVPVFSFFADEEDVAFECSLDDAPFSSCPDTFPALSDGVHSLSVKAHDAAGHLDITPTTYTYAWRVDTVAPDTFIVPRFEPVTSNAVPAFDFTANEPGVSYECSLDGAPYTPCPATFVPLSDGAHTLAVQARDAAGTVDPTAARHAWRVDTVAPKTPTLLEPAAGQTLYTATPRFAGSAEPGSTVTLTVDGIEVTAQADDTGAWSLYPTTPLTWGTHVATLRATDAAGNTSPASAEWSFLSSRQGYYGSGCSAAPSLGASWPWAVLLLGLLRRRAAR